MTNSSHGHMLNENIYSKLMADRERVRNQLIDQMGGQKPTEDEVDAWRMKVDEVAKKKTSPLF